MLNCENAKKIDLTSYLIKLGFKPSKTTLKNVWFCSPFRSEAKASFKVSITKNVWFDYGEGIGGTIIDFVMKYNNSSVKEALVILNADTFSFHQQPKLIKPRKELNYEITKVGQIKHPNLISYIQQRKLNLEYVIKYCFQVHYKFNSNEYYGIGFLNNSGAFEARNKYFKGCLGKKEITTINNNSDVVSLFEGWSDFIAYLTYLNEIPKENFIILNSTALVRKVIDLISDFKKVKTYFDVDTAGEKATALVKESCKNEFEDCRKIYKEYKDFNKFLINR